MTEKDLMIQDLRRENETLRQLIRISTEAAAPGDHTTCYTIAELAEIWRCSSDIIYDLLRSNKLKGFKLGRSWRISDEARLNYEHSAAEDRTPCPCPAPATVKIPKIY